MRKSSPREKSRGCRAICVSGRIPLYRTFPRDYWSNRRKFSSWKIQIRKIAERLSSIWRRNDIAQKVFQSIDIDFEQNEMTSGLFQLDLFRVVGAFYYPIGDWKKFKFKFIAPAAHEERIILRDVRAVGRFFRWTKASCYDRRPSDRPTNRPTDRSALRNVTASKFDSHISVARGAVAAPVFTAAAAAGLEEFLLPATSPRTFTHTAERTARTRIPVLSSSCDGPRSPRQAETMSGARASRESRTARGLSAPRRDVRRWRWRWLRENRPRSITFWNIYVMQRGTGDFFFSCQAWHVQSPGSSTNLELLFSETNQTVYLLSNFENRNFKLKMCRLKIYPIFNQA